MCMRIPSNFMYVAQGKIIARGMMMSSPSAADNTQLKIKIGAEIFVALLVMYILYTTYDTTLGTNSVCKGKSPTLVFWGCVLPITLSLLTTSPYFTSSRPLSPLPPLHPP